MEHFYYNDEEDFTLFFLDDDVFDSPASYIEQLTTDDHRTLYVVINSRGGDIFVVFSLAVLFKKYDKVITIGLGWVYSAAAMVFLLGDQRYVGEFCLFMMHGVSYTGEGSIKNTQKYFTAVKKLLDAFSRKIELPLTEEEDYYTADELIDKGVARKVTKKLLAKFNGLYDEKDFTLDTE